MTTVAEPPAPVEDSQDTATPSAGALERMLRRPSSTTGFWSWFTTIDHKKIAILYAVTAIIFFVVGGVEALLIRLQLFGPDGGVLTAGQYNAMFTMHGTTMVFLFAMPMAAASRSPSGRKPTKMVTRFSASQRNPSTDRRSTAPSSRTSSPEASYS